MSGRLPEDRQTPGEVCPRRLSQCVSDGVSARPAPSRWGKPNAWRRLAPASPAPLVVGATVTTALLSEGCLRTDQCFCYSFSWRGPVPVPPWPFPPGSKPKPTIPVLLQMWLLQPKARTCRHTCLCPSRMSAGDLEALGKTPSKGCKNRGSQL